MPDLVPGTLGYISSVTVLPVRPANCTQNVKIKTGLVVTNLTRFSCRPNRITLMPANPWSPVLLTWFDSEQSPGDQILFQHCSWQAELMHREEMSRTGKQTDHPYTIPSYMHQNTTLNNIPVNTISQVT